MTLAALIRKPGVGAVATATVAIPAIPDVNSSNCSKNSSSKPLNHEPANQDEDTLEAFKERAAEGLAKPQPQAKPLTIDEDARIRGWLTHIGETDGTVIGTVLGQCARDPSALAYFLKRAEEVPKPPPSFDDRRTCSECAHLVRGICMAARWGEIQGGGRYMPVPDLLRRCEGFKDQ